MESQICHPQIHENMFSKNRKKLCGNLLGHNETIACLSPQNYLMRRPVKVYSPVHVIHVDCTEALGVCEQTNLALWNY